MSVRSLTIFPCKIKAYSMRYAACLASSRLATPAISAPIDNTPSTASNSPVTSFPINFKQALPITRPTTSPIYLSLKYCTGSFSRSFFKSSISSYNASPGSEHFCRSSNIFASASYKHNVVTIYSVIVTPSESIFWISPAASFLKYFTIASTSVLFSSNPALSSFFTAPSKSFTFFSSPKTPLAFSKESFTFPTYFSLILSSDISCIKYKSVCLRPSSFK